MTTSPIRRIQRSKLLRPAPSRWELVRPRLIEQLNEGLSAPLSLITGIAGSGKTSLARDWAASLSSNSVWISLDASDNALPRFLELLGTATAAVYPPVGSSLLTELAMQPVLTPGDLAIAFANEVLAYDGPVIVILDDFHTSTSPEIYAFIEYLLQFPPPNLHICFVSRIDPPLPLVRYRARFGFTEIRLAQLLFDRTETEGFLKRAVPVELPEASIDQLQARTEGWIAGIQLAALALRKDSSSASIGIGMQRQAISDSINYIGEEIVHQQPVDIERVLTRLAVPDRVCASLAAALLEEDMTEGRAQRLLDTFEERGLFLTALGEDRTWFRFHPLFRDTLLEVFEREDGSAAISQIHVRASCWFVEHQQIGPAIMHLLLAGNTSEALELVANQAQAALISDRWRDVEEWLRQLPLEERHNSIELTLAKAWVHQARGDYRPLLAEAERARELLVSSDEGGLPVDRAVLETEISLLETIARIETIPHESLLQIGVKSEQLLREHNRLAYLASIYLMTRGSVYLGRQREALEFLQRIVDTESAGPSARLGPRDSWALFFINLLHFMAGDLTAARATATRQLMLSEQRGAMRMSSQAHTTLGRIAHELNDLPTAIHHLRVAVDPLHSGIIILSDATLALALAAEKSHQPELARATIDRLLSFFFDRSVDWDPAAVRAFQARLAWTAGNREIALAWARTANIRLDDRFGFTGVETPQVTQTMILLNDDIPENRDRARDNLSYLEQVAAEMGIRPRMVELRLMRAFDLEREGRIEDALDAMGEAIQMATGHIRTFLDLGAPFGRLFRCYVERRGASGHTRVLLEALDVEERGMTAPYPGSPVTSEKNGNAPVTSPLGDNFGLSSREVEILHLLEQRMSNKEIADQLSISPLTVKRHTSNIYQKLGVTSRRQAIHAAQVFAGRT